MSRLSLETILKECRSRAFQKFHNIQIVSAGENGDIFLHKECLDFLRMIRRFLPGTKVQAYTNFRMFSPPLIDAVLGEGLLDFIGCNIDGADQESYFKVKRTDLGVVTSHLFYFLKKRRRLWKNIPLHIQVLTYHDYVKSVHNCLGVFPEKLQGQPPDTAVLKDDFPLIRAQFLPYLDHPKDKILRSAVIAWAERDQLKYPDEAACALDCPQLDRIEKEAFIAPDGTWYACCWDGKNELALGNVLKESFNEIYFGTKRRRLIESLKRREFALVGGPCAKIQCCQELKIPKASFSACPK
ncbi:MAG: radical SAM/SPASM domain-containing protein [Candidatus Omnitrophota bacterium]